MSSLRSGEKSLVAASIKLPRLHVTLLWTRWAGPAVTCTSSSSATTTSARKLAWVHPDQAKARRAIAVPLNAEAMALINKQIGKHATHVFSYKGSTITQVSTKAWYAALERAGIENFRWHDLRHTWASWHVQNGTPLFALQEMGGWASTDMVRRYAHLAADHLAPYAERLGTLRVVAENCDGDLTPNLVRDGVRVRG